MSISITVNCCGGNTERACYGINCPLYNKAESKLKEANYPWVPTGFGGLYGSPKRSEILLEVASLIAKKEDE